MNKARLLWHDYKYLPYERLLARREVEAITNTAAEEDAEGLHVAVELRHATDLKRVTYFKSIQAAAGTLVPDQARLEASANSSAQVSLMEWDTPPALRRQSTRYSAHGLHEYRGKFNPQVVRAIGNMMGLQAGDWVLDPFCGSGTTLLEAAHSGWNGVGFDVNPLAVMIANAKIAAFKADPGRLKRAMDCLASSLKFTPQACLENWQTSLPNREYLARWFTVPVLCELARISQEINTLPMPELRDVFRVILSDICREVSLQDPADLRIRRRKEAEQTHNVVSLFLETLHAKIGMILRARQEIAPCVSTQRALFSDCRSSYNAAQEFLAQNARHNVDAAICSPPYATALPYVDTQRLSLCLLGLIQAEDIRKVEKTLIGNREISDAERVQLEHALTANSAALPSDVWRFCCLLLDAADDTSHGFRRRNVPGLIYKYFQQMAEMFAVMERLIKRGGKYALLVGSNKTTLRGQEIEIDTPHLLGSIAASRGWQMEETLVFDTYQRYDAHQKNSIRHEVLLVLSNQGAGRNGISTGNSPIKA